MCLIFRFDELPLYIRNGFHCIERYLTDKEIARLGKHVTEADVKLVTTLANKVYKKSAADIKKVVTSFPTDIF